MTTTQLAKIRRTARKEEFKAVRKQMRALKAKGMDFSHLGSDPDLYQIYLKIKFEGGAA